MFFSDFFAELFPDTFFDTFGLLFASLLGGFRASFFIVFLAPFLEASRPPGWRPTRCEPTPPVGLPVVLGARGGNKGGGVLTSTVNNHFPQPDGPC